MSLEVSSAALERVQFTNKLGPPYALNISAKRCALFNIDEGGDRPARPHEGGRKGSDSTMKKENGRRPGMRLYVR
jgi:hypothetical protein